MDNRAILARTPQHQAPHGASAARRAVKWLADVLLPTENPAGTILGLILIGALLAAESASHETYLDTFASAAITAVMYWLAHSYAHELEARLESGRRLTFSALLQALGRQATLIRGASIPLLALVVAALAGASQETAVTVAVWSAVASLVMFELIAGLRAEMSRGELVLETSVGAAMGLAILALKIVLH